MTIGDGIAVAGFWVGIGLVWIGIFYGLSRRN